MLVTRFLKLLDLFLLSATMGFSENGSNWPRTVDVAIFPESIPAKSNSYAFGNIARS